MTCHFSLNLFIQIIELYFCFTSDCSWS